MPSPSLNICSLLIWIYIYFCLLCKKRTQDPVEDLGREAFEFTMDDTLGHQEGLGRIDLEQQVDEILPKTKKNVIGCSED